VKPIIRVENLSKEYVIGGPAEPYSTLRESLVKKVKAPFNAFRNGRGNGNQKFWALKDINFEVTPGEVVGIIGRNGAGKSTLLKILSRITEPTTGKVDLYGRVGSLLEVGTGFHPELTGRENIFLNGAILGMKREEIARKFDEIVDFAEIEEFLATPVKRYSSGRYVRLAFAVAAHLEPEILVVDEVLAVGDSEFQKKCLGKMQSVARTGRTVLFVSHNLSAVKQLCTMGLLLIRGKMEFFGDVMKALEQYQYREGGDVAMRDKSETQDLSLVRWELTDKLGSSSYSSYTREVAEFKVGIEVSKFCRQVELGFILRDSRDDIIFSANTRDFKGELFDLEPGRYNFYFRIRLPLRAGQYTVDLAAAVENELIDHWVSAKPLTILDDYAGVLTEKWRGLVTEEFSYSHEKAT